MIMIMCYISYIKNLIMLPPVPQKLKKNPLIATHMRLWGFL